MWPVTLVLVWRHSRLGKATLAATAIDDAARAAVHRLDPLRRQGRFLSPFHPPLGVHAGGAGAGDAQVEGAAGPDALSIAGLIAMARCPQLRRRPRLSGAYALLPCLGTTAYRHWQIWRANRRSRYGRMCCSARSPIRSICGIGRCSSSMRISPAIARTARLSKRLLSLPRWRSQPPPGTSSSNLPADGGSSPACMCCTARWPRPRSPASLFDCCKSGLPRTASAGGPRAEQLQADDGAPLPRASTVVG